MCLRTSVHLNLPHLNPPPTCFDRFSSFFRLWKLRGFSPNFVEARHFQTSDFVSNFARRAKRKQLRICEELRVFEEFPRRVKFRSCVYFCFRIDYATFPLSPICVKEDRETLVNFRIGWPGSLILSCEKSCRGKSPEIRSNLTKTCNGNFTILYAHLKIERMKIFEDFRVHMLYKLFACFSFLKFSSPTLLLLIEINILICEKFFQ